MPRKAVDQGKDVLRRVDASLLAVLGVTFRNKIDRVRVSK